eukprot:TRINITY_DN16937_c0_g1_i1.p1 TRINITY_DN16937_c0_g1~~TRINITY_DN16937_c0_g1_i1.p1  ORF type:complete len:343 (+),score=98.04 TRINITY_DN16937_c0_g1_i1:47-1075(+)
MCDERKERLVESVQSLSVVPEDELRFFPSELLANNNVGRTVIALDNIHVLSKKEVVRLCSLEDRHTFNQHCFTGMHINPAAQVMARFIIAHWDWIKHSHVVELGSGVGLSGLIAAQLLSQSSGAHFASTSHGDDCASEMAKPSSSLFVMTDGEQAAVELGRKNLSSMRRQSKHANAVSFHQLLWDIPSVHELLANCNQVEEGFDIVLGADLIYARVDIHQLIRTARALLGSGGSKKSIVFIFLPRVAEFPEQLRQACEHEGLQVKYGRINSFLTEKFVYEKFWHNIEFCVMFPQDESSEFGSREYQEMWNLQDLSVREEQEREDQIQWSEDVFTQSLGNIQI